jgi:hypothetical protein
MLKRQSNCILKRTHSNCIDRQHFFFKLKFISTYSSAKSKRNCEEKYHPLNTKQTRIKELKQIDKK